MARLTSGALGAIPGLDGTKAAETIEKINQALEGMATALEGIGLGIDGAQASGDKQEALATASPVAIKIADEKMMAALKGLGGLGADLLGKFIPLIGTMKNGADCVARSSAAPSISRQAGRPGSRSAAGSTPPPAACPPSPAWPPRP